jgi:hypothetical protein
VSDDSRYFLTVESFWNDKNKKWFARMAVRSLPDGKIVCAFERDKAIESQPKFATGNSSMLIWSFDDTVFFQTWKPSKRAQKLSPRR